MDTTPLPEQSPLIHSIPKAPQAFVDREFKGIVGNYNQTAPESLMAAETHLATTAAVYGSHISRGESFSSENLPMRPERIEAITHHAGNLAAEAAVGMATVKGVDERGRKLQLHELTYRGRTSEHYEAQHQAWLLAFQAQQAQNARRALAELGDDESDAEDNEDSNSSARKKSGKKKKTTRSESGLVA